MQYMEDDRPDSELTRRALKAKNSKASKLTADEQRTIIAAEYKLKLEETKKLKEKEKEFNKELSKYEFESSLAAAKNAGDIIKSSWDYAGDKLKEAGEELKNNLASGAYTSNIVSELDKVINSYIEKQTSMAAHLVGTGVSLNDISRTLSSALSTTSLIKQEDVYNKLNRLLSNGITYNVEQRAFLQTLAENIDLTFDAANSSLARLVRIQSTDMTANRLAIEYSLQEFLNSNYATSEYIKNSFTSVSDALISSQALMGTSDAINYESMVQTWLGSYYSSGISGNTVSNLASAINALGSGDTSGLGKGISNLILMGVARAGLNYGDLLTNGINASDVNKLMGGVTSYLNEMGSNNSNVVKSQLSSLFGVDISDLVAAGNIRDVRSGVSSDLSSTLLADYEGYVPLANRYNNLISNLMYSWGTNVASSTGQYVAYQVEKMIANSGIGDSFIDIGSTLSGFKGLASTLLGVGLKNAPILSLFTSGTLGDMMNFTSLNTKGANALTNILSALGSNPLNTTVKMSSTGMSEGTYIGNGSSSDILNSYKGSANDSFGTAVNVSQEGPTIDENVATITENVVNIYSLLSDKLDYLERIYLSMSSSMSAGLVNYDFTGA